MQLDLHNFLIFYDKVHLYHKLIYWLQGKKKTGYYTSLFRLNYFLLFYRPDFNPTVFSASFKSSICGSRVLFTKEGFH